MIRRNFAGLTQLLLVTFLLLWIVSGTSSLMAQNKAGGGKMRSVTNAQRKAAAARAAKRRVAEHQGASKTQTQTQAQKEGVTPNGPVGPALTLDQLYFGTYPNFANSPLPQTDVNGAVLGGGIRKFVDTLPGLNSPNNLGQQISVAVADQTTFPGSDYYEIAVVQYQEKLHSDLPPTTLRGYVQLNAPVQMQPHYLGPLIVAQRNIPVRIKFVNMLPAGAGGNLFIPVDKTVMGSGMGPDGISPYLENRATLHLHGGNTPWISDGTPHQWTVPAGDSATTYPKGVSTAYVPDMFFDSTGNVVPVPKCDAITTTNCWPNAVPAGLSNNPGPGAMTFYYTNQQSARLMFYHDHSYGITRLNVYAGEAAGYLLQDPTEAALVAAGTVPATQIPLIIQDKTFVPPNPASAPVYSIGMLSGGSNYNVATTTVAIDPFATACATAPTGVPVIGDALGDFGSVIHNAVLSITLTNKGAGCTTSPDVVINDTAAIPGTGATAFASLATLAQQDPTWDTTLWGGEGNLWFPHVYMPNQYPDNPDGSNMNGMGRLDYGMWFWPPMVVGPPGSGQLIHGDVPCPTTAIPNQRCPGFPAVGNPDPATGTTVSLLPEAFMDTPVVNGTAYPTVTVPAGAVRFRILNAANDRNMNLSLFVADPTIPCAAGVVVPGCDVKMVPASVTSGWPVYWPTDGRDGGVPDPATAGPSWIQIGNEAGLMPNPVVIPPTPVGYEYNRRSVTVLNISSKGLFIGPAERADVIVDFSAFAGKTLILYNDAPAPVPAFDSRYDYYTGDPDQTGMGGAPTTIPGYGPNTRTMMQIVVGAPDGTSANLAALQTQLPAAFAASQPPPIVPQAAYSAAYGKLFPDVFARLQNHNLNFTPVGGTTPVTLPMQDKTIQELFELDYGRMNATLGTELPFTNFNRQTTVPLGYIDPPTEILTDSLPVAMQPVGTLGDGTQIWQITHNGVDTHTIHFHLFNVQVVNRFGWDGTTRPPDPNEIGWKESVRMNPLEIDYVALRPMSQNLPWPLPDSVRPLDVTMPPDVYDPMMSLQNSAGRAADMINHTTNFGWEYVWHCHLLGHEENDMMRPIILQVLPPTPSSLAAVANITGGIDLTWIDNSANEAGFILERDTDLAFSAPAAIAVPSSIPNSAFGGAITYTDTTVTTSAQVYYRVKAVAGSLISGWSNIAPFIAAPIASIVPKGPLAFGNQGMGTTSSVQTVTLSNTGTGALSLDPAVNPGFGIAIVSPDFAQTNTCGASLAPGATCVVSVTFTPSTIGALAASLTIAGNDPVNSMFTVLLNGTGTATTATVINAPAINYGLNGVVTVSITSLQVPTVTGNVTLTVDGGAPLSQALVGGSAIFTLTTPAAGNHALVADYVAQAGFQASNATGTLVVNGIPLTITASSATMPYGGPVPVIAPSFTGFVNGETSGVLTTQPTCSTTATPATPVGTQTAANTCTGATATNYTISYVPGDMTVTSVPLTITASSANIGYGSSVPTITASYAGFLNGDTAANLTKPPTCSTTYTATSPVGTYPTSCSGAVDPNYTISYVAGAVNVSRIAATVTPNPASKIYGTADPAPLTTGTLTGFLAADNVSATYTRVTGENVGTYVISATLAPANVLSNYTIANNTALFTISKAKSATAITGNAPNPANVSQPVTVSFVVTPQFGGLPTGSVMVTANSGETCTGALNGGGIGSCQIAFLSAGVKTLTATYAGDGNFTGSVSAGVSQGVTGAGAIVSPTALAFANQLLGTTSATQTAILSNLGNSTLTINSITIGGANPGDFVQASNCPRTLQAGRNCQINVRFRPTATGARIATVAISSSDPINPTLNVTLSGTGVSAPAVTLTPASLTFTVQRVGTTSAPQTVTLTSSGGSALIFSAITIAGGNTGDFAQTTSCPIGGTGLAPGASCTASVTFTPTKKNQRSSTLRISDNAPTSPQSVPLSGTGQ